MKTTRNYSNLCLKLEGVEHVYWANEEKEDIREKSNSKNTISNTYKSYEMHNLLVDFHGTANQGQYLFPFSLLLPNMMTGSFTYSENCYIKYILRA